MKLLVAVCLLGHLFSLSSSTTLSYECPEPEEIFPCYCEEEDGDPTVYCNHLTTPEQLYNGVQGLKGFRIYRMSFFMNWILDPIKPDAFKNLAVERLFFENSTIRLVAPHFQGLESHLSSIQLRAVFNKTNPVIPLDLEHLTKLREIIFEKNRITALPNEWIKSVPDSVRSVSVEENTIITLEDEVFSKIKRLTFLVLDNNRILIIKRSMFPNPADDLRSIHLNNNKIRYLPDDIFSDMPNLRNLEISGNRLTTLEESVWSKIFTQLTKLDVLENEIECNYNLKWILTNRMPSIIEGKCEKPDKLRNKSIQFLTESDLK